MAKLKTKMKMDWINFNCFKKIVFVKFCLNCAFVLCLLLLLKELEAP